MVTASTVSPWRENWVSRKAASTWPSTQPRADPWFVTPSLRYFVSSHLTLIPKPRSHLQLELLVLLIALDLAALAIATVHFHFSH
jgi:hypothetical protein